jgi:hypothetical protein
MWIPNRKQCKSKESRHVPWFVALWKGRGACWSSRMGLGRIDKLQLLTRTCTKLTQGGWCIVGTRLVLKRATGNSNSQDSPLGGSHHLPPYSILCASPRRPHPNGILSWDSQVGVSKFLNLGLLQLWGPITFSIDLQLIWGLKQSFISCWKIFNDMWHATYTQGNRVDSRLLVIRSQIANLTLTLGPSFDHNLCFRCANESYKLILDIYVPRSFQWYKKRFSNEFWPLQLLSKDSRVHRDSNSPKWEFPWECEGSFPRILLHSRKHEMWLPGFPLGSHSCKPLP